MAAPRRNRTRGTGPVEVEDARRGVRARPEAKRVKPAGPVGTSRGMVKRERPQRPDPAPAKRAPKRPGRPKHRGVDTTKRA